MKRLSEDLKRMLNALALQDAADFLPMRDKLSVLGLNGGKDKVAQDLPPTPPRRVAVLSDGGDSDGVLQYALDACQRQQASLDLVLYGEAREQAEEIRTQLQRRGIAHEIILLGEHSVEALTEYLHARRTLTYLVAPADDRLALQLTEEATPHRGGRLHLPMVLVDRTPQSRINRINAA
jgi:hypothetical protein